MREMVRLREDQIEEASHVLARAFADDPLQRYTFPNEEDNRRLSPLHFEAMVRYGVLAAEVWTTEGSVDAVGIWWPPEHRTMNEEAMDRSGILQLDRVLGEDAVSRFLGVIEYVEAVHQEIMPGPHWYAMLLGVDHGKQGQGLGGQMLAPMLARADAAGLPACLDTLQPRNVAFYRKHGFQVVREGVEPVSGLAYWSFVRTPI